MTQIIADKIKVFVREFHELTRILAIEALRGEAAAKKEGVFGGTPNTASGTRALPISDLLLDVLPNSCQFAKFADKKSVFNRG